MLVNFTKSTKKEDILTRTELAKLLNVSRPTLNSWEKDKPELIRLINQGFVLDETIEEAERNLKRLKEIKQKAQSTKLIIK